MTSVEDDAPRGANGEAVDNERGGDAADKAGAHRNDDGAGGAGGRRYDEEAARDTSETDNVPGMEPDGYVAFDPMTSHVDEYMELAGDRTESEDGTGMRCVPISLQWSDLSFSVRKSRGLCGRGGTESKPILRSVSGYVKPGQMLAILGGSGAGKSTLLNMLAGRVPAGKYDTGGDLYVNGGQRNVFLFRKSAAYVEQDDAMFAELTVREQLELSARLRLPSTKSAAKKMERVEQVITELGLRKVIDSKIGSTTERGISGGERKRVNIGTELVTNPSLLLLDEPTSGLDSFQAQAVMFTMLRLAKSGRTVVATVHQPRSQIFQMFDSLLLLSEGRQMYFGKADQMVPYFASLRYPCPEYFNPADFALDLISLDARSKKLERQTRARIVHLADKHQEHLEKEPLPPLESPADHSSAATALTNESGGSTWQSLQAAFGGGVHKYNENWFTQFRLLSARSLKLVLRERDANKARLGQTVLFSILLGLIWLNTGRDLSPGDLSAQTAVAGVLFFLLINQSFGGVFGVVFLFPLERAIVLRERASKTYRVSAYFLSKTVAEFPRTVVFALLFSVITYWMVGLKATAGAFFIFVLAVILSVFAAESVTLLASAPAKNPQAAAAVAPVFIVISLLFGGFFIGTDTIPVWLAWIRFLSFIYYGFNALMLSEFSGVSGGSGTSPLERFDINSLGIAGNLALLFGLSVLFRSIAYVLLRVNGPRFDKSV